MRSHFNAAKIHFDSVVGQTVAERRRELGLSQNALALRAKHLSKATVHAVEEGRGCSFHVACLIAEALDLPANALAPLAATDDP